MAVRLTSANSQALTISTSVFDSSTTYTVCFWLYPLTVSQEDTFFLVGVNNGGNTYQFHDIFYVTTGNTTLWAAHNGVGSAQTSTTNLVANTWAHVAIVRESASSLKLYLDGVLCATNTYDITGRGVTDFVSLGYYVPQYPDARYYAWKAWTTNLSQAEILAEKPVVAPVKTASLWSYSPFDPGATRPNDFSANGHNWTEVGTLTDEDPPPLSSNNTLRLSGGRILMVNGQPIFVAS